MPEGLIRTACGRLVLDTNTVMALWHYADPRLARLARHVAQPGCMLLTRADALEEFRLVLAYRQFGIAPERQHALFEHYAARCEILPSGPLAAMPGAALPVCRDADDQKFLEIARDGQADCLVSRDRMLLRLNRHRLVRGLYRIASPEQLETELAERCSA